MSEVRRSGRGAKLGPQNHWWVHGESHRTPEHSSWQAMISRCTRPNHVAYHRYGGRGITICPQWLGNDGYVQFLADMGRRPTMGHTLDRIDQNGGYEPSNCRWATKQEQQSNLRTSVFVHLNGDRITVAEAARRSGIAESTIRLWSRADLDVTARVSERRDRAHA